MVISWDREIIQCILLVALFHYNDNISNAFLQSMKYYNTRHNSHSHNRGGDTIHVNRHLNNPYFQRRNNQKKDDDDDGELNMDILKQRIEKQEQQYYNFFINDNDDDDGDDGDSRPDIVYLILFNPETEDQGVHTIEFPKGSGFNTILAFESEDECFKFASMLQDMHFYQPTVQETPLEELQDYCNSIGMPLKVVYEGIHDLTPPSDEVDDLSFNPSSSSSSSSSTTEELLETFDNTDNDDDEDSCWQ